jgi:general secretion pathway protein K
MSGIGFRRGDGLAAGGRVCQCGAADVDQPPIGCHFRSAGDRGIALLAVLWTLLLLSLIAASFTAVTRTEVRLARNTLDNAKAEALADAAVHRAVLELLKPPAVDDTEADWRVDGTVYAWGYDGGELRVSVQDEGGKLDLNATPNNLLQALFVSVGVEDDAAAALTDAILDFRDSDDLRRLNGAESGDYEDAGLPFGPKNQAFETVEELRQVLGITAELYDRVAPALTVHSRRRLPFRLTSPPEVQAAFAAAIEARREGASPPRQPTGRGAAEPVPRSAFSQALEDEGINPRSPVNVFTIQAEARIEGRSVFAREVLVRVREDDDEPFRFLAWRRGARRLFEIGEQVE